MIDEQQNSQGMLDYLWRNCVFSSTWYQINIVDFMEMRFSKLYPSYSKHPCFNPSIHPSILTLWTLLPHKHFISSFMEPSWPLDVQWHGHWPVGHVQVGHSGQAAKFMWLLYGHWSVNPFRNPIGHPNSCRHCNSTIAGPIRSITRCMERMTIGSLDFWSASDLSCRI